MSSLRRGSGGAGRDVGGTEGAGQARGSSGQVMGSGQPASSGFSSQVSMTGRSLSGGAGTGRDGSVAEPLGVRELPGAGEPLDDPSPSAELAWPPQLGRVPSLSTSNTRGTAPFRRRSRNCER